jgi:uncharacterized protein
VATEAAQATQPTARRHRLSATILLLAWTAVLGVGAWRVLTSTWVEPSEPRAGALIAFATQPPAPQPPAAPAIPATRPTPPAAAPPTAAPPISPPDARAVPAWQRHQQPFDANDRRPRIALIIGELGMQQALVERALALPGPITLMFDPYSDNLPDLIARARRAGHEVLVGVPMEPSNPQAVDSGPLVLLTSLDAAQNRARLGRMLERADGAVGIANIHGERFAVSPDAVRPMLESLAERGLLLVDARTTPRSVMARLASELGVPRAINDRAIDEDPVRSAIDARLAEIERIAREAGTAVALGSRYPLTLDRIAAWLPTLAEKGFALAPITAVINRQRDR